MERAETSRCQLYKDRIMKNISIEQSEINEMTENLQRFSVLVDLYFEGRADENMFMSELAKFEGIDWAKENMLNQLLAYNALAAAYGNLKSKSLSYTEAYYDNEYVYKEITYYHNVHYVVSRVAKEQWAALYRTAFRMWCRAYLCMANAYDHLGRFCEAQQCYRLAAMDNMNVADVEMNQGYSYANMHAFWEEEEPWIIRKAQQLMRKYEQRYKQTAPRLMYGIYGLVAPSFDAPQVDFSNIKNGEYEKWVNENYLRLNRFCDVEQFSQLSLQDNVKLPCIIDANERQGLLTTAFDEIKRIFIDTRKIVFDAIVRNDDVYIELLKMSYKNLYSILDKIAVFLQAYLYLPIEVYQVDFAKIWYDKKGNLRQEFVSRRENLSLLALYNVNLDVYGSKKFGYLKDEQTKNLQRIRNFLEHKMVVVRDGEMKFDDYRLEISQNELKISTIRLAQLVRCTIIYLCNFVIHSEYDKTHSI